MKDKTPKIIAVDFDGTLCTNAYPEIGEPIPYSLLYVTRAKAAGHIITLHTCRQGKSLDDAIAWCKARGITFDYINENVPANIKRFGGDTRKIYADVYFDANSLNPLRTFGIGDNDEKRRVIRPCGRIDRKGIMQRCLPLSAMEGGGYVLRVRRLLFVTRLPRRTTRKQ